MLGFFVFIQYYHKFGIDQVDNVDSILWSEQKIIIHILN